MGFLERLRNRKNREEASSRSESDKTSNENQIQNAVKDNRTVEELRRDPNLVRVFDEYGRELFIEKEQWRTNLLPDNLAKNWENPDALYGMIVGALNDELAVDVEGAAEHLYKIDSNAERGACLYGIVLLKLAKWDAAETVFQEYLSKYGVSGVILTNLAKVYGGKKDQTLEDATLWRAIEADPNQENGLGWFLAKEFERGGAGARTAAMRRVAVLPRSWRVRLWLAQEALQAGDSVSAIALYREGLSCFEEQIPADFLFQMSGNLGQAGLLKELIELTEPHFVVEQHGLPIGNNLIKAHYDRGELDAAQTILDKLYAQRRPDWNETLQFWDTEIARKRVEQTPPVEAKQLQVTVLQLDGPIWLTPESEARLLFRPRMNNALAVSFLGGTATVKQTSQEAGQIKLQLADAIGRMSRAVPLFLAEQAELVCGVAARTLVPWVANGAGGFVVSGSAWGDIEAVELVRRGEGPHDLCVTTHVESTDEQWQIHLALLNVVDGKRVSETAVSFTMGRPEEAIPELGQRLCMMLQTYDVRSAVSADGRYVPLHGAAFSSYLLRLEQLLAVRCSTQGEDGSRTMLHGEREILEGNLRLCLDLPQCVQTRILLIQTLLGMQKVNSAVAEEFRPRVALLGSQYPLGDPADNVIHRMLDAAGLNA